MSTPITSIPNLGPAMAAGYARAGITSAEELRELGADAAYAKWLATGQSAHLLGYIALVMGLQGRPWNDARGGEKDALRARFEALKAQQAQTPTGIEQMLDVIGVRPRP